MKKQLLFILASLCFISVSAQQIKQETEGVFHLLKNNAVSIGLSANDLDNIEISSTYESANGLRMVYVQQTYQGIPVFNSMQVLAFRNERLVSVTGNRIPFMDQLVNTGNAIPAISAEQAVNTAITDQKLVAKSSIVQLNRSGRRINFGKLGVSSTDIIAEPVWLPISNKDVRLTWQVEIAPVGSADHFLIRMDASTGVVLDKNNFTVYEEFNKKTPAQDQSNNNNGFLTVPEPNSPSVVNSAIYRVVSYPAESPNHTGGTPALVTDPWTLAPGNATSLKWHYDGTIYHDSTRGNNVWAQEDRDNNNSTFGKTAISTTGQPTLNFDFTPNFTQAPTVLANQQFATTNLFYWNNIVHDLTYLYGFDEPSGNFQANNQGRGGLGNDYVIADAQDAGGTNNANFSTPDDGSRPRMQMYLFTGTTPNRDGDIDNGVIVHEYGHGVSNRLTGGPANSSCLSNAEQGGEGWSDYLALMATTNWATATVNDGPLARPMGTYVLGQATTGAGIRTHPYSTNMSINPWTYADMTGSGGEVHTIGEIWCTALWEMTWELIAMDGINPNLFNPSGTGGNSAALKLVIEGMRLQPCSPGYIDARNAILKADTLNFGAKYSCAIWKAFAKRGMGKFASQGSSNSTSDQVADFTNNGSASLLLTQNVTQQQEGLNIVYTNHVSAGTCGSLSNYTLRDTLPSNVSYVSGGTYDATNKVVSFAVNLSTGQSQDYSFTVKVNAGSYYAPVTVLDEPVAGATISSAWTTSSTTTTNWAVSSAQSISSPNSFFSLNLTSVSDQKIQTTNNIGLPVSKPKLSFQGYINSEPGWDGGVVEISTDNGTNWTDLGPKFISGGYNGSLSNLGSNAIRGRSAFTGNSNGFVKSTISLSSYAGQNVKLRFRFGSDESVAATGWYVDDILVKDIAMVEMRSSLFNGSNIRLTYSDTFTLILPCTVGAINTQPSNATACRNGAANFSVNASGTNLNYQWQLSTNGGNSFTDIAGATTNTLALSSITPSMNNYQYHCVINGDCTSNLVSNAATLTVNDPVAPAGQGGLTCGTGTVTISAIPGAGETIDWYSLPLNGSVLPGGSGTTSYTTQTISSTTTYYAASRNITTGCVSASRTAVVATVGANTNSTTSISICSDQLPYTWNNTVFTQGGVYTVHLTNSAGCDSAAKLLLDVAAVLNVYNVTGGGSYPVGGGGVPVGLSGSQPGIHYQLIRDGSVTMGSLVTGTGNPINFGNQTVAGTYTVVAAYGELCPKNMAGSATVIITTGPPTAFIVTGGGTYCTGGAGLVIGLAGSQTGVSYQLQRSNGSINAGAPVSGTGNAISFGLQTTADTYTVLATNTTTLVTQPMLNSVFIRIAALRTPSAPGAITGPTDACPYIGQGNAIYTIRQAANATSYLWTAPAGATIIGSNTDTMVVVQYGASFVSGNLSVVSVNSCFNNSTSTARNLAITKRVPGTPGTITSSLSNVCPVVGNGGTVTYSINKVTYATSYNWSVSAGIHLISVLGDTSIVVSFNSGFATGTVAVVAINNCATSSQRSLTVKATVPSTPAVINGQANVCSFIGQPTTANYSIAGISGASSYSWTAPANSNIVSGQGTNSIDISFAPGFAGGTLSVRAIAACGNSSARSLSLTKNVAKPGIINASAAACPLATVTYSITPVPFATSYQWSVPANATYVSGQGTTSFTVTYKATFVSGTVTVKSINSCSTSAGSSLSVSASGCTARRDLYVSDQVLITAPSVYPNPNNGIFTVSVNNVENSSGTIRFRIVDVYGKSVFEQQHAVNKTGMFKATIKAPGLIPGIYELQYYDRSGMKAIKFVVIK